MGKHTVRLTAAILLGAAAALIGLPASATPGSTVDSGVERIEALVASPEMLAAMQRDLRLTPEQVSTRLVQEQQAMAIAASLNPSLADASWFDPSSGKLVVAVTDQAMADRVRSAGAEATLVRYAQTELNGVKDSLDRLAQADVPDAVTSWYVDVPSNRVMITIDPATRDAAADRFLAAATALGDMVQVAEVNGRPQPQANLRGGDQWNIGVPWCSVGFTATGPGGSKHFLTAGHCTKDYIGRAAESADGTPLGTVAAGTFSRTGDFGKVNVTAPGWVLTPKVNGYGRGDVTITGSTEAAVTQTICKSGRTTKFTCGKIVAKNVTVNYASGEVVEGMTRTTACTGPGDSGGAFISGTQAQGLHSGSSGCTNGVSDSYFQPVKEALGAFGLTLMRG